MGKRTNKQEDKRAKRLQQLLGRINAAEKWRDNAYQEPWKQNYKQYRNHVDAITDKNGNVDKERSNISVPYSFTMVETVLPRLVETLFAARPYVTIKGRTREWTQNARSMETLIDYQQNEVMDIQDEFHIGLKIMAIYGTAVAYTGWKYQERTVTKKERQQVHLKDPDTEEMIPLYDEDPVTGEQIPVEDFMPVIVNEKEYDDPEVKFIDLGLFYVDPNAKDIDDARYCGHVCYMSKDQIDGLVEQGFLDQIDWEKVEKGKKQNNARNDRMGAIGLPTVDDNNLEQSGDDDLFECHYYWEDDVSAFIINRSYVARDRENPFWHKKKPYDKDVYCKVPGEFYGIGLMEIIEDQQAELNTERNMRIDYRKHNLRRMFGVRRGANLNRNQLVWKQNGIIEMDDVNEDLKIFDPPSIHGDTFNEEEVVKQDMRDATGAHDVVMGTASSSETATTTMSKDNNASMRFKLIISSVEKRLLVSITRKMIQLNQQFIDDVRTLPIFDGKEDDWIDIAPEEIQGEFHLIAAGSSVEPMANKEAYKQRMVELFTIVQNNPIMQQYPQYIIELLRKVFEAFDITDTDGLLPGDNELNGLADQQAIGRFIGSLPPELQQILSKFVQQPPPQATGQPMRSGGGANTAAMQEQGLQLVQGGGGP